MNIYHYNHISKEYTHTSKAELDPIDKKPLIPANATKDAVPADILGFVWVRDIQLSSWVKYEDNRGKVYSKETAEEVDYKQIGPLAADFTKLKPPFSHNIFSNGRWVFDLQSAKVSKIYEININLRNAMSAITSAYTRDEIDTWQIQQDEAAAYNADQTAHTPFIDSLVESRAAYDKAKMVARILTKAEIYKSISGKLIGKKQDYIDQLESLTNDATQADVDAIIVNYNA